MSSPVSSQSEPPSSTSNSSAVPVISYVLVASLTYMMFFMFAMTTDAVGEVIKISKAMMGLTNVQASAFHWATMVAIAASGIGLGFLADKLGRKRTIIIGLTAYGISSALFIVGQSFYLYLTLLFISGLAIGVFKTAALALIGDIAKSTQDHTAKMNAVEGFFGLGAIVGPMLVVWLTSRGLSWTWLYVIAACLCLFMVIAAMFTKYPTPIINHERETKSSFGHTISLISSRYVLSFSIAIMLYVACEVSIFVWLPTFLEGFSGSSHENFIAAYAVMIFFILRAAGRFLGSFILNILDWKLVVFVFTGAIFLCFLTSVYFGVSAAIFLLPASGLFMSVIYPTLNSKGISCYPKSDHGAVAGLILFFTAVSAAFVPLIMALVSDKFGGGDMIAGFIFVTGLAGLLFAMAAWNWLTNPASVALASADQSEYA